MAASNKPTARKSVAANAGATNGEANTDTGTETSKTRKQVSADEIIYWNEERDIALLGILLPANGQITAKNLCQGLAQHPAFAADAHLLHADRASEKVRQHVKKLSEQSVEMGGPELVLRRAANTGYDSRDTLARFLKGGIGQGQAGMQAPVPSATSPYPTYPGVGVAGVGTGMGIGGLIPTT